MPYLCSFLQELVILFWFVYVVDGDTVRVFSHDNEILRAFDVVNPQDIYLVRSPEPSDVSVISKSNIRSFIQEQLKVGLMVICNYSNRMIN